MKGGQKVKLCIPREAISFPCPQPSSENTSIPGPVMRRTFVPNVYKPVLPVRPLATTGCLVTFLIFLLHSMPQIQMSTLSVRRAQEHTGALPPQSSGSQHCCGDPALRFCVGIFTWTGFLLVCYFGYLILRWGLTISLLWQEWVWICDSPGTLLAPTSRVLWLPVSPHTTSSTSEKQGFSRAYVLNDCGPVGQKSYDEGTHSCSSRGAWVSL